MIVINGVVLKERHDYLQKGRRDRLNLSIRHDLKKDLKALSDYTGEPYAVMIDVFVEMLQNDEELLQRFLKECKNY